VCGATLHPTTLIQLHYDAVITRYSVTCDLGLTDVDYRCNKRFNTLFLKYIVVTNT